MEKSFAELKINEKICAVLKESGITLATPVQEMTIPLIRSGKDVVVQAQTGTGKTLAFLLPIFERIKTGAPAVQALVVAPTRELAIQIAGVAEKVGRSVGIRTAAVYGGQALERQIQKFSHQPQLVIGTPGRLLDHLRRGTLSLASVNKVVLDEADQMLHMGFLDDVEALLEQTAADRQTMLFSATIPDRIRGLSRRYMIAPQDVRIDPETITLDGIEQVALDCGEDAKLDKLCALINEDRPYLAMVFCHTKQRAAQVAASLAQRGYLVDELHGDLTQAKRTQVMKKFASAKLQILVATDIAARGLDVEGVTHVFNYDIPHDADTYIHRIGRTGRAGERGKAITFVNPRQHEYLRLIERGIRSRLFKQKNERRAEKPAAAAAARQPAQPKKEFVSLSKYANRKGAGHGGGNQRSRRQGAAAGRARTGGKRGAWR